MKYWFDITNTPHVHIVDGLKRSLQSDDADFVITARDFSEVLPLLTRKFNGHPVDVIGKHAGNNKFKKAYNVVERFFKIYKKSFDYDVSISMGSESAIWTSFIKRKPSIAFGDNDTAKQWTYGLFVDYAFFPDAIPRKVLEKQGLKNKLYLYDGYKEDIYISEYIPDHQFKQYLPFEEYILVRPENIQANYINNRAGTITRQVLEKLSVSGRKIMFLPRYDTDKEYAVGIENVYIPDRPVNGLDACYHAEAVLTGAGTFAREAACLGIPAISFFAGRNLLAVDRKMIEDGWLVHSRDPNEIISQIKSIKKRDVTIERSIEVKDGIITKLKEVIEKLVS